jgi:hypothetical protein
VSTPQEADTTSSHSGGLFRPAYTQDDDVRLPASYREWIFGGGATGLGRQIRSSTCVSCHTEHGAVDNVFVQFYPVRTESE